jgi:hypothetical protein
MRLQKHTTTRTPRKPKTIKGTQSYKPCSYSLLFIEADKKDKKEN